MSTENNKHICPVELAGSLDNSIRRLLQNPRKILSPFIIKGMTVLDLGCGPGFFSMEIAQMLNNSGKVIAADLQEGMLEKLRQKIKGTEFENKIELHKCQDDNIGITEKVDFVLAFYMIHEVSGQDKLFKELKSVLNPDGKILIVEPKLHVSKKSFEKMIEKIEGIGLQIIDRPKLLFSRSVVLAKKKL